MERSFERGQSGKSSDKNQGRAGEVTRRLAEAQLGKDLRGLSSPQSSEMHKIPKNLIDNHHPENTKEPEEALVYTHLSPDMQQKIYRMVLPEKFLDIYKDNNEHNSRTEIDFLEKERNKLVTYNLRTAIDSIEKEGGPLVAHKFVKLLTDKRFLKDPETQLRMISAIGKLGDPSVVPKLLNILSSNILQKESLYQAAIAGVAVRLDRQCAVPVLLKSIFAYDCDQWNIGTPRAIAIGMSGDQSVVQELEWRVRSIDLRGYDFDGEPKKIFFNGINHAIKMLKEPSSVGPELVKAISEEYTPIDSLLCIAGKLGDISVAQALVDKLSCYDAESHTSKLDIIPRTITEICSRADSPTEIKGLSKKLLNVLERKEIYFSSKLTSEIPKALAELGKILPSEDAEELSGKLVTMFFHGDEAHSHEAAPFIANAMFELEQHLAEPNPLNRLLDAERVKQNACKKIKEKILEYRQKLVETDADISHFYESLTQAAFFDETCIEMRIGVFRPIMKTAGPSFAPKLEDCAGKCITADGTLFRNEKDWFMNKVEHNRMRKFAHDLRNPSSSNAENLPPNNSIKPNHQLMAMLLGWLWRRRRRAISR
jgi:hypothetical protein